MPPAEDRVETVANKLAGDWVEFLGNSLGDLAEALAGNLGNTLAETLDKLAELPAVSPAHSLA